MSHSLPELGYSYDALEPFIDAKTMEIHHSKHHQAYTNKFNEALDGHADLQALTAEKLISDLSKVPEGIRNAVRNHGGGFINHKLFWTLLKKDIKFAGPAADAISARFGGLEQFKAKFSAAATGQFGSGWAWLVMNNGELDIMGTANQDSPLSSGRFPLLALDVWEHAYYLKYQNRRPEYVDAFFNVINWEKVSEYYLAAKK